MRTDALGFRERMHQAQEAFADYLEELGRKRLEQPEGNRGSDVLLMFFLNGLRPHKYRPNPPMTDETAKDLVAELRKLQRSRRAETVIDQDGRPVSDTDGG